MQHRSIISAHRFARLVAWLGAVLAWCALGWALTSAAQRRHHERYGSLGIDTLRRAVVHLIFIRAAQLLGPRPLRTRRNFAPTGFRRRIREHLSYRAIGGVWLRRHLNVRGGFVVQVRRLIEVLRHVRGLAACLARRRRRGLTRVNPIVMIHAIAAPLRASIAAAPALADTS